MEQAYLTEINIKQVRNLKDIRIELSQNEKKHLLLTGINGCGKTSVLKAIENSFFHVMSFNGGREWIEIDLSSYSYECLVDSLFSTTAFSDVMGNKYGRYQELVEKADTRSISEDKELVDLIKYFKSIPIFMAKDIILDFQKTERQRKYDKDK